MVPRQNPQVSIIVPTYNESQNIISMLKSIRENIPKGMLAETIVVDDNSPDGTGRLVEDYVEGLRRLAEDTVNVVHRKVRKGLASAILNGIQSAKADTIIVMDSDFSHPPQVIPRLLETLRQYQCDLVVASRYVRGGGTRGWPFKRRMISKGAALIAKLGLRVKTKDPMSGFFAFRRNIINGLTFDALGYKFLLEVLVKANENITIREVPYTFENRRLGKSKLDASLYKTVTEYLRAVWKLYKSKRIQEAAARERKSVRFVSKAARFFTVGASGFGVNYLVSMLFASGLSEFWYVHANALGIAASLSTNFILNKVWTFEDHDFGLKRTLSQYGRFAAFSSLGAAVQLGAVYWMVDTHGVSYPLALFAAIAAAAFGNFILNKKLTFREGIWD